MPPLETSYLRQKAVLWRAEGTDNYGEVLRGTPEELDVRWRWNTGQSVGTEGGTLPVDASVVVAVDVPVGSVMWLGRLADWDPSEPQEVMSVDTYRETPDLKNRNVYRVLGLRKYKATLPRPAPVEG